MTETKVVKVYDNDCPICEWTSTFDSSVVFQLTPGNYETVPLERILDPSLVDPKLALYAYLLERHAVNDDYTIDLPVYLVLRGKDYLGHVKGEVTQQELREGLEEKINAADSKSRSI